MTINSHLIFLCTLMLVDSKNNTVYIVVLCIFSCFLSTEKIIPNPTFIGLFVLTGVALREDSVNI